MSDARRLKLTDGVNTPVVQRCGLPARLLAVDLKNPDFPIAAVISGVEGEGREDLIARRIDGRLFIDDVDPSDLINAPRTVTRWVGVTNAGNIGSELYCGEDEPRIYGWACAVPVEITIPE